jgi:hypothetical protein
MLLVISLGRLAETRSVGSELYAVTWHFGKLLTRACHGQAILYIVPDIMDFFHEYGGDPLKPSLFELVAQEQLRDLLQPALKYVLSVSPNIVVLSSTVFELGFSL